MKIELFKGWCCTGLILDVNPYFPNNIVVRLNFRKLKAQSGEALQQALWRLKERPESFIQKVSLRVQSKLVLRQYEDVFSFAPKANFAVGKELKISYFKAYPEAVLRSEELLGYMYQFALDSFCFEFLHPLKGLSYENCYIYSYPYVVSENILYLDYKDIFCKPGQKFIINELSKYILASMHKQFDFLEANGQRMEWYKELLFQLKASKQLLRASVLSYLPPVDELKIVSSDFSTYTFTRQYLKLDFLLREGDF